MKKINSYYKNCLVLDSSYMPRSIVTVERAFVVSYKGNAEVIDTYPEYFQTVNKNTVYLKPSIIRVFRFVHKDYQKVPLTRANIYKRDGYRCVYCGSNDRSSLTLDHVIPQSKGGKDSWNNLVTACRPCNGLKADLTIEEWGKEDPKPKRPHFLMLMKNLHFIPEEWKPYLFL